MPPLPGLDVILNRFVAPALGRAGLKYGARQGRAAGDSAVSRTGAKPGLLLTGYHSLQPPHPARSG
jgi:hypothetical protein